MTDRERAIVEAYKTEDVRNILLVLDDESLFKVILTWPKVKKQFINSIDPSPSLDFIWDSLEIDFRDWAERCNMKVIDLRKVFKMLSSNNIIFPDGEIANHVNSFLTRKSVSILNKVIQASTPDKPKEPQPQKNGVTDEQ